MKRYCVAVARTGCLFVEAENPEEAMDIANHQTTDMVNWSDDWEPTDVFEDSSELDGSYVRDRSFD